MKKITLLLSMFFLVFGNFASFGQGVWSPQTNPTTDSGESMQFVSETEGWISLKSNALLHTVNGGSTWIVVTPEPNQSSFGIDAPGSRLSFANATTGYVLKNKTNPDAGISTAGVLLYKTTDGGANWQKTVLSTVAGDAGIQIQFTDANHGWVLIFNMTTMNGGFLKTNDGGASWTPADGRGIFQFIDNNIGFAWTGSGDGGTSAPYTTYKTTDGGNNWTTSFEDNTAGEINDIHFSDANHGWIVGYNGKIFKTIDGGTNWIAVTSAGLTINDKNNEVFFVDANTGWIATKLSSGENVLLYTNDGGTSWTQQTSPSFNYKIFSMYFTSATYGWVAVDGGNIVHYTASLAVKNIISGSKKLAFYPNPSDGNFNFYIKDPKAKLNISIYNFVGQKVFETTNTDMKNENIILFQPSAKGMYLIKVFDGEKEFSEKIIIK